MKSFTFYSVFILMLWLSSLSSAQDAIRLLVRADDMDVSHDPEYFALQPDGTPSGFPEPRRAKLCQSNPAVWDQWLVDVEEILKQHPDQKIFNAAPNDSANSGICVCENCRAWDHPDGEKWPYRWEGITEEYVAMSDRYVTFTNHLARKLKERFPDRELYVSQFAYHCTTPPPVAAIPDDNIVVAYIGYFPLTDESARQQEKAHLKGWAQMAPKLIYRPNYWGYFGSLGLLQVAMKKTIEDLRFLAENNCIGIWIDTAWEH